MFPPLSSQRQCNFCSHSPPLRHSANKIATSCSHQRALLHIRQAYCTGWSNRNEHDVYKIILCHFACTSGSHRLHRTNDCSTSGKYTLCHLFCAIPSIHTAIKHCHIDIYIYDRIYYILHALMAHLILDDNVHYVHHYSSIHCEPVLSLKREEEKRIRRKNRLFSCKERWKYTASSEMWMRRSELKSLCQLCAKLSTLHRMVFIVDVDVP